jgi:hypothetical protein
VAGATASGGDSSDPYPATGGAGPSGGFTSSGGVDAGAPGGTSGAGSNRCSQYASLRNLLNEADHWGPPVRYRSAETMIVKVRRKGPNSICYLEQSGALECRDSVAQSSWRYQPEGGAVVDFELSPEGELVVAERVPSPVQDKSFLAVSRLDATGSRTANKIVVDSPTDSDLVQYDVLPSGQINVGTLTVADISHEDRPFLVRSIGWRRETLVQLEWIAERLYVLAYTYAGLRLYQLTQELDVNWRAPVMPVLLMSVALERKAGLVQGPGSEIQVIFDMAEVEDQVFEQHFSRTLDKAITAQDIVVASFSDKGVFQTLTPIGKQEYWEYFADAVRVGETVWVAGNIRSKKRDTPNDTTELDIALLEFDPVTCVMKNHFMLDYQDEDYALSIDALPSGNLLIGGRTGYIQVDTNSEVTYGSGLLLEVAPNGQPLRSATFATPRDVGVMNVVPLDADCQLFAGWNDAPITHTCEADPSANCRHVSGMVALTPLVQR